MEIALWAAAHEPQIHYRQSRPIDGRGDPFKLPLFTDCSGSITCFYEWAGAPDPNGLGFSGQGLTGTLLGHLPHISRRAVQPADLVVFDSGDGHHVCIVVEAGPDPGLVSHGQGRGPIRIGFADELQAQQNRPVTWLCGLPG